MENTQEAKKPVSNVRNYFTKEINDQIQEMGMKEMESLLKEMVSLRQWIALLKYTGIRMSLLEASLRVANPYKEPDKISQFQGIMAGLSDVENYVIDLNAPPTPAEKVEMPEQDLPQGGITIGV
jgi:hypothetical protein